MVMLRGYQEQLVADVRTSIARKTNLKFAKPRPLMVCPTGGGKTVMFSYIANGIHHRGKRVAIFVHRDELIGQVSATLARFGVPHGIIGAGTGVDRSKLVQVVSVQTYSRSLPQMPVFDYIIIDEAHHAIAGSTWDKCLARSPLAIVIGVTATPERLGGEGLDSTFDDLIMGPTVKDLIRWGVVNPGEGLCDYRLWNPPGAEFADDKLVAGDFNRAVSEGGVDKPAIYGSVLDHYRQHCDGMPSVAFCTSVAHAEKMAEEFRSQGYRAASVDGKMDKVIRKAIIQDFSMGRINMLTSCEILSEGFDCPGIMAGFLVRRTASLALFLQQVGRMLRPMKGKGKAMIFDHVGNWARHGLPCDDRAWSLQGHAGRKSKAEAGDDPMERRCPFCDAVQRSRATVRCEECGLDLPVKHREVEEVGGTLGEADVEAIRAQRREVSPERRAQGMAKDIDALVEVRRLKASTDGVEFDEDKARRWAGYVLEGRKKKRGSSADDELASRYG